MLVMLNTFNPLTSSRPNDSVFHLARLARLTLCNSFYHHMVNNYLKQEKIITHCDFKGGGGW